MISIARQAAAEGGAGAAPKESFMPRRYPVVGAKGRQYFSSKVGRGSSVRFIGPLPILNGAPQATYFQGNSTMLPLTAFSATSR